jgi:hypothetical protein
MPPEGSPSPIVVALCFGPPLPDLCHSAPQQKDHNDDYQYRAEPPAIIMVWSAHIETATAEKENQNNQE